MGLGKDCAQHVAEIVYGCAGLTFGGIVAAVSGPAAATTTLVALAVMEHNKAKPDDKEKIDRLIGKLADAADKASKTEPHERGQVIRAAEAALSKYLPKMDITHYQLVRDAFEVGGFPIAATARILKALAKIEEDEKVAETDRLFGAPHGKPDAIKLAEDIFNATFEQALTNKDYFQEIYPHAFFLLTETVGKIDQTQDKQGETLKLQSDDLASIKATLAEMQAAQSVPPSLSEGQVFSIQSNDEPKIVGLQDMACEAIERAEFDKAEILLAEAEQLDFYAGEIHVRRAVNSREKRGEVAAAQGHHIEAADHYAEAAKRVWTVDTMEWARLKFQEGGAAYQRGQYHPEPEIMRRAITAYHEALKERTRERVPMHWATTQNNLGTALSMLGERGDDAAL